MTAKATFPEALGIVADGLDALRAQLDPRELIVLQIGLHASHAEEAIAHGDADRAKAHGKSLGELFTQLVATPR